MKVLVTDDAKFMRVALGNILRKMGHEIVEAESGLDALKKYREHRPDLVTMDITMPEMDGVEAVERGKPYVNPFTADSVVIVAGFTGDVKGQVVYSFHNGYTKKVVGVM